MLTKKSIIYCCLLAIIAWSILKLNSEEPFSPEHHISGTNMIITGASSGIGREAAILACEMGANVFITARKKKPLEEIIQKCKEVGQEGRIFEYRTADMSDLNEAAIIVHEAVQSLGGIDFLVLNHGTVGRIGMFMHNNEGMRQLKKTFDTNFFSFVEMTNTAMKYLIKSRGRIVVVSSMAGDMTGLFNSNYASSKASMNGFFRSLENENYFKEVNVSYTVFVPGAIDTPMYSELLYGLQLEGVDFRGSAAGSLGIPVSPRECAYAMIRSTALRETKSYYPDTITNRLMVLFAQSFPDYFKRALKVSLGK